MEAESSQIRGLGPNSAQFRLARFGCLRKSVPPAPLDTQIRVRGVEHCRLHRFSSNSELWEVDFGQISPS